MGENYGNSEGIIGKIKSIIGSSLAPTPIYSYAASYIELATVECYHIISVSVLVLVNTFNLIAVHGSYLKYW